ncbi:Uridine 5'-monophosphate synthase [Aphelenchoides bicaudatus]|nr:Uridine 5'-monophosphate synthase [Aphelenchoides bicaudatus]
MPEYSISLESFINENAAVDEDTFIEHIRKHGVFKLGEFVLKSGYLSPIYIDFRGLISSQQLMNETAFMVREQISDSNLNYDYVVGVPYAALSLGSRVSLFANKPLLMQRKEAKNYGTKKLIEGVYEEGGRALIIEDVVTTGASILETAKILRNEGLVVEDVVCVLNREQGAKFLQIFCVLGHVNDQQLAEIREALQNPKKPADNGKQSLATWSLSNRSDELRKNRLNGRLLDIMLKKKSNLCVAVDLPDAKQVLDIVRQIQDHVCAIKLHADSLNGANDQFFSEIRQLAQTGNFVLFEDRKFADTGNTNYLQVVNGPHKIAEWADLVTAHSLPGTAAVQSFEPAIKDSNTALSGVLLVAELSTEGALTDEGAYTTKTVQMAKQCPNVVSGFICQKRCSDQLGLFFWTPGVNLQQRSDGKGQQWRGVDDALTQDGNDIIIVGRGITAASDVKAEAQRYQQAAWAELEAREK